MFLQIDKHYQNGSYVGVLVPTCGLMELEALVLKKEEYLSEIPNINDLCRETRRWLVQKYNGTSKYNQKFIIRSFYNCGALDDLHQTVDEFKENLYQIALDGTVTDKLEIDLCLDVDVCSVYLSSVGDKREIRNRIHESLANILSKQMQNGRWDNNLGKTARILVFLLKHKKDPEFERSESDVKRSIDSGIIALKNSYQSSNWEENIVTTANAITAIIAADANAEYESKDFLNQVNKEAKLADSYNSLLLALKTIDELTISNGKKAKSYIS